MTKLNTNLRKAAVFIRSLDGETAARMLARLSPDEAAALRDAIRAVRQLDPEEQADVVAEFRSARPVAAESAGAGVELALTSTSESVQPGPIAPAEPDNSHGKRFEFLEKAPIEALVPYLAREHVQTIAVVLSHLAPPRAAAVVAALPDKLQAEVLERLAALGETDPDSVVVVERELASWLARRTSHRSLDVRRNEAVAAILASTDALTRSQILANLRNQKSELAGRLGEAAPSQPQVDSMRRKPRSTEFSHQAAACAKRIAAGVPQQVAQNSVTLSRSAVPAPPRRLALSVPPFDDLIRLDARTLAAVLREVDVEVLVLALAGSREEMAQRVCDQVPRRSARVLRRQLRQLGPTRLSDVEAAQRAVSLVAARHLATRQAGPMAAAAS
jgi:flagellar motor switch protein FliG